MIETIHTSEPGLTDIVRSANNSAEVVRSRGYSRPGEAACICTNTGNGFIANFPSNNSAQQDYFLCMDYSQARDLVLALSHFQSELGFNAAFAADKRAALAERERWETAAVVGPTNKVLWLLMAQYGMNMTVGEDMDNLLNFGRDVWNAALSTIQPTAQQERIHDQIAAEVAMAADKRRPT